MIRSDRSRTPRDLLPAIDGMFELSAAKILSLDRSWSSDGAPVFTVAGKYTARGWTEWTEGFVYGAALLQFDATGDRALPRSGPDAHRRADVAAPHPRRRSRSRVQQRQHLRHPVAAGPRRPHRRGAVASALLRAGAQGERRGPGATVDAPALRRLHLFVQRRALAVCRHHPIAARARPVAFARPPVERRTGRASRPARSPAAARARHRAVQRLLRPGARHLRRARPRRARVAVQCGQRHPPRAQQPARLLAVHDLDARPGLGHARLRRTDRVSRDDARRGVRRREPRRG